jgi:photosystem II stability/assembly factor-like uncharacterized protein
MRKILLLLFFTTPYWQVNAQLKISTTATKLCDGTTIPLQATGIPANSTLQWQKDGVDIANANTANYSSSTAGSYVAKALGKDVGWTRKSPNIEYPHLQDVFFVNSKIGYAVGEETIIKTIDGGVTWQEQKATIRSYLRSVYFISELTGWAVGDFGQVFYTNDGGISWKNITQGNDWNSNDFFYNVQFIDTKVGFINNGGNKTLRTIDGGITWTVNLSSQSDGCQEAFYLDANTGFITDFSGIIRKTVDGGKTWSKVYDISINDPQKNYVIKNITFIYFIDKNIGWAVGYDGLMIATTDGGKTWTNKRGVNDGLYFHSIIFTDSNNGFALTYADQFLQTTDGGKTWILKNIGAKIGTYKTTFVDSKNGFSIGADGIVLKTTNGGISWEKLRGNSEVYQDICFVNTSIGYRVGDYGKIDKTIDGGITWKSQNSNTSDFITQVQFIDANTGWTSSYFDSSILTTTDGGNTWKAFKLSSNGRRYTYFKFLDSKNGFAVGGGPGIIKTTDGGVTWSELRTSLDANTTLNHIFFSDSKNGWITGANGILARTIDGGNSWSKILIGSDYDVINCLGSYFFDTKNGFVLSNNPFLLKTTNGGVTWSKTPLPMNRLRSITFTDDKNGWINDEYGIYKTTDGGNNWINSNKGTKKTINNLFFTNAQIGWAVGFGSTMIKYDNLTLATSNTITINPKPAAPTVAWSNTDAKLTATSTSAGTLAWLKGTTDIPNITTTTYQPTSSGSYSVRVTDANGCAEVSKAIEITILSSENPLNESGVSVFPNPSSNGIFKVAYTRFSNEMEASMQIIGLDGMPLNSQKMVRQNNVFEGEINASNLSTGIYFLQVVSGEQKAVVKISVAK